MSFQNAKQFIIDFYANPSISMKIFKIHNKKINLPDKIRHILKYAKSKGYDFSLYDLIKAVQFKKNLQKDKIKHIFGMPCLNYEMLNKNSDEKTKSIEQMLSF